MLYCRRGFLALRGFCGSAGHGSGCLPPYSLLFQRFSTYIPVKEAVLSSCCAWPELHTVPMQLRSIMLMSQCVAPSFMCLASLLEAAFTSFQETQ